MGDLTRPLSKRVLVVALLLGAVLPLFLQLGNRGLFEPDEGRYSEMGREMVVSGDWMVPRLGGVPHWAKPPWIYWCVGASLKIFGLNETAARLPAALAATAIVFCIFCLGRKMAGPLAGLFSALIWSSSLLPFMVARLITPDMMLTAFITLALYCFWNWWDASSVGVVGTPRRGGPGSGLGAAPNGVGALPSLLGFYVSLAFAFFDKGPVGIVVPFLTIVGFLALGGEMRTLKKLSLGWGLLLVAALALPWFFWMCHLNSDLWDFFLVGEIKNRVVEGRGRVKSWYYFFLVLPLACWPWTGLVTKAIASHLSEWSFRDRAGAVSRFLLSWTLLPFLLFTVVTSKLPTYILPVLVPISLMLGIWLAAQVERGANAIPRWSKFLTGFLMPAILIALAFFMQKRMGPFTGLWSLVVAGSLLCLLGGWLSARSMEGRPFIRRLILWWSITAFLLQFIVFFSPKVETELGHNSSWRTLCEPLAGMNLVGIPITRDLHPSSRKPEFARAGPRVVMYDFYFQSGSFYLLKERNEYVPRYGGGSHWEIGRDLDAEAKLTRDDLIELLKAGEKVYVFSRAPKREELMGLTGLQLPLIKTAASGKYEVVLFSN